MDSSLFPITDLHLKETIDNLLLVQNKITNIRNKITVQKDEITKTEDIIEKFKTCHNEQNEALKKFVDEEIKLVNETESLLEIIQKKSEVPQTHQNDLPFFNSDNNLLSQFQSNPISIQKDIRNEHVRSAETIDLSKSDSTSTFANIKKKLKRKLSATSPSISKNPKKKLKSDQVQNCVVNVQIQINPAPLEKVTSLRNDVDIHKIVIVKNDIFMSGSNGLLVRKQKVLNTYYTGHQTNFVKNFYIFNNISVISFGHNYVIINPLNECIKYEYITKFSTNIVCTAVYNSKIFGILEDGNMFVLDMKLKKVIEIFKLTRDTVVAMVVIKFNKKKMMILGNSKSEIISYSLDARNWLEASKPLLIHGKLRGMLTYSGSIICYTTHSIYLLDKNVWKVNLIREITSEIIFLEADMNNLIVLDISNILHKYIIKKGKIRHGSSVENLNMKEKVNAMFFSFANKRIYFASGNSLYYQRF